MPISTVLPSSVYGKNLVTTSNSMAVNAGIEVLNTGGNAVDSAIAAAACLAVVEPTMNGLGGDMMALVWEHGSIHALEGIGWSPKSWEGLESPRNLRGWSTVTIPGQVRGWSALHKTFGRKNWAQLFTRAQGYARDGFIVSKKTAALWNNLPQELTSQPGFIDEFLRAGAPKEGDFYKPHNITRSLKLISETYGEDFYNGEIAKAIVQQANSNAHSWTMDDLDLWKPKWVQAVTRQIDSTMLHEMPPPSQGIACTLAMSIYEKCKSTRENANPAQRVHLEIECMKLAIQCTQPICADYDANFSDATAALSESSVNALAASIDFEKAIVPEKIGHQSGGTVLIVTADSRGQVCALIQSNFYGFGSGVVIPGFGLSLHNRGVGFSMNASPQNLMRGRKKPFHTLAPAMVTDGEGLLHAFGVMGGTLQPQGHFQILLSLMRGESLEQAITKPRWRIRDTKTVCFEEGYDRNLIKELEKMGHSCKTEDFSQFGGAQWISRAANAHWQGFSDNRKDGHAAAL